MLGLKITAITTLFIIFFLNIVGLVYCEIYNPPGYINQNLPLLKEHSVTKETKSGVLSNFYNIPLHFVANDGQMDKSVVYYAKSDGANVYCTNEGLIFSFPKGSISLRLSD
jgi:hypothetical protein